MAELICFAGEKGGVGKSFVCRTAIQWHLDKGNIPFQVYETDRSNPDVRRIYGNSTNCNVAIIAEGERYEDASNSIFNTAIEQRVLVNLPAQCFIPIKNWVEQNSLLELAQETGVTFQFWHVTDGGFDSISLLRKLIENFKDGVEYVVCKNYGKTEDFEALDTDQALQKLLKKYKATVINFPKFIGSVTRNKIDAESLTFSAALEYSDFDLIAKQRIRKFLKEAYAAFEHAGVFTSKQGNHE